MARSRETKTGPLSSRQPALTQTQQFEHLAILPGECRDGVISFHKNQLLLLFVGLVLWLFFSTRAFVRPCMHAKELLVRIPFHQEMT